MSFLSRSFPAILTCCLSALPLAAQSLPAPEGEPLLTVTGNIALTNQGDAAVFDQAMLEAMDPVTITTSTIWTEGEQTFTGVPLAQLVDLLGAEGEVMMASAINDYTVEIPREDWIENGPIVAFLNNGEPMSIRDKGPLWIIYPYDDNPDYQTEVIYSRSIWQLDQIQIGD